MARDFEYEPRATALRGFEHVLVPGLAQTAGYARAVLATQPNTTEEQVDEFVTARLERQVILDRDQPPLLCLVIDEAVLHREVGGAKDPLGPVLVVTPEDWHVFTATVQAGDLGLR